MRFVRLASAVVAATVGFSLANVGTAAADAAANMQTVRDLLADLSGTAVITDTHHQDVVFHNPTGEYGIEHATANAAAIAAAFPDLRAEIVEIIGGDDWVIVQYTLSGTFTNPLVLGPEPVQTIAPTGRSFSIEVHTAYIFDAEGKIIHEVQSLDPGDQERQLFGE